jgi:hypothetical protein
MDQMLSGTSCGGRVIARRGSVGVGDVKDAMRFDTVSRSIRPA